VKLVSLLLTAAAAIPLAFASLAAKPASKLESIHKI